MKMIIAAALAAFLIVAPVQAQVQCGDRTRIAAALADQYGEVQQSVSIHNDTAIEIWANLDTDTWTALSTSTDGISCILAYGDDYSERLLDAAPLDAAPGERL